MTQLERDQYGYAIGDWHPVAAEHNDALCAWHQGGNCSSADSRYEEASDELARMRRQIEDRLRKDRHFLYEVASLIK